MAMKTDNIHILKQDSLGRVIVSKEHREELLDAFESSSMSGQAFATHHGIHVQTFANWMQKRRRARGDYENEDVRRQLRMGKKKQPKPKTTRTPASLSLIEVDMESGIETTSTSALEITLPGGAVIKVTSEKQFSLLKSLLHTLSC